MTDDKTPGDGTHELRLPGKPGADASTPSDAESSESSQSTSSGPSSTDAQTPAKAAEGFTWGLRPRGPDRTSAPPTAAIILPSFVQPELPTNGAPNAAATGDGQNSTAAGDGAQSAAGGSERSQNDRAQNGSAQNGRAQNSNTQNGAGADAAAAAGARPVPATSRRARVTEPTEPPPLVEPPRTKRTVSAVELATQAMSLEEILAAQEARPVTRETWSRPIPTQGAQNGQAAQPGQAGQNGQNAQSGQTAQSGQPGQSGRATEDAESVHTIAHSRRSHLPQTAASAEAEAAAVTSLPAALAPGAGTGAATTTDSSDGTATVASTSNGFANNAASSAADPDLSTQALSAQDVRDAETPRYRPRRAHMPEGVHDRNPAPADVVVAPTFRQADSAHALPQLPATRAADKGIKRSAVSPGMPHGQKVLLWIAGSLVMVLVLVAMYLLSSRLGEQSVADNQGAGEAVDADPTPVLTVDSGPVAPGVHDWTELAGGECLTDFESAWAEEFTVVDCADEHTAQVLTRAELSAGPDAPFPGAETLTTDVGVLCGLPAVLNYGEAAAVNDIQVSSSHPVDAADWASGDRTYFCFVDRASGDALPGDLQVVPSS